MFHSSLELITIIGMRCNEMILYEVRLFQTRELSVISKQCF